MGQWRSCDDWFTLKTLRLSFSVKCIIDRTQIKTKRRCELALLLCINASHFKTIRQINKASLSCVVFLVTSPFFLTLSKPVNIKKCYANELIHLRLTKLLWILTSMLICICLCGRLSSKPLYGSKYIWCSFSMQASRKTCPYACLKEYKTRYGFY